jgi:hypothetical protein
MDSSITFLTRVYISFSVAQHDVTHHLAYQSELLSSRTVSTRNQWDIFIPAYIYLGYTRCECAKEVIEIRVFKGIKAFKQV